MKKKILFTFFVFIWKYLDSDKDNSSLSIAPTRDCTNFLKIGVVVAGSVFFIISTKGIKQLKKGKL